MKKILELIGYGGILLNPGNEGARVILPTNEAEYKEILGREDTRACCSKDSPMT